MNVTAIEHLGGAPVSSVPTPARYTPGLLLVLFMLVVWVLPAQAGDQYPDAGNRKYSNAPASKGRRYPPRNNKNQEQPDYVDKRTDSRNRKGRDYDRRNSSGRYYEAEPVTEQRQYKKGRRAPYSSEAQGRGKSSDGRTGNGMSRNTSLDDAVSWARRKSQGRVLSAETVQKNNQEEHRVRIITDDGRVRRYRLDALTGNLLPRKR